MIKQEEKNIENGLECKKYLLKNGKKLNSGLPRKLLIVPALLEAATNELSQLGIPENKQSERYGG